MLALLNSGMGPQISNLKYRPYSTGLGYIAALGGRNSLEPFCRHFFPLWSCSYLLVFTGLFFGEQPKPGNRLLHSTDILPNHRRGVRLVLLG